jgi:hypothetical protein
MKVLEIFQDLPFTSKEDELSSLHDKAIILLEKMLRVFNKSKLLPPHTLEAIDLRIIEIKSNERWDLIDLCKKLMSHIRVHVLNNNYRTETQISLIRILDNYKNQLNSVTKRLTKILTELPK